jgi:hypothetical protein
MNKPVLENITVLQDGKSVQYCSVEIPQNEYKEKHYQCLMDTVFTPEYQQPVSEAHSKIRFSATKTAQGKDFQARFHILSTDVSGNNQEVLKLLDLTQLLSVPTQEIVCLLNSNGEIKKVLNTEQIYRKWEEVFETIKQGSTDEQFIDRISEKGRQAFSNPMADIEKTQLYNLFFFPLFHKQFNSGKTALFNIPETSHLLQEKIIEIELKEKTMETDCNNVIFHFEGNALNDRELFLESKKIFESILSQDAMYHACLSVQYNINAEYGYPVFILSELKETLVGLFSYKQKLEIREEL